MQIWVIRAAHTVHLCAQKRTQRPIRTHKRARFLSSSHTHILKLGKHRSHLAYKPDQRASSLQQTKYICYNSFTSSSVPCLLSHFLSLFLSLFFFQSLSSWIWATGHGECLIRLFWLFLALSAKDRLFLSYPEANSQPFKVAQNVRHVTCKWGEILANECSAEVKYRTDT